MAECLFTYIRNGVSVDRFLYAYDDLSLFSAYHTKPVLCSPKSAVEDIMCLYASFQGVLGEIAGGSPYEWRDE